MTQRHNESRKILLALMRFAGVVIQSSSEAYVGEKINVTCLSDTQTEKIEWFTHTTKEVLTVLEMTQELILPFSPVNDSVHGKTYTCRVTRGRGEVAEQNFTMNVKGKE